jgi:hypothetical protein
MIFSDLPSPAEASSQNGDPWHGFAQAENRCTLFGIMLWLRAAAVLWDSFDRCSRHQPILLPLPCARHF